MTTNFEDPDCKVFEGAKRHVTFKTPSLPQDKEEQYAELTYEERLDYELKESESKLKTLDLMASSIKKPSIKECKPKGSNYLHAQVLISPNGMKFISDFKDPCLQTNAPKSVSGDQSNELKDLGLRQHRHPRTVRKYVSVLLAFFSNLETEYVDEEGHIFVKKLPVIYGTREKLISIKEHEFQSLTNGNTNMLPRASLVIDTIEYDSNRQLNKALPVSKNITMSSLSGQNPYAEVMYAPSPYSFSIRMQIMTRGINDALMIVEQIGSFFNPFYNIQIIENEAGIESTIRVKFEGCSFEPLDLDEYSNNEMLTELNFTLYGNLFKGIKEERLAEFIKINYFI